LGSWTAVRVPRGSYHCPQLCPSCLGRGPLSEIRLKSDEEKPRGFYLIARRYEYLRVAVPFCADCARRQLRQSRLGALLVLGALAVSVAVAIWLDASRFEGFLLAVLIAGPAIWFADRWGRVVRVTHYDDEAITFTFKSDEYARAFEQVNSIEARQLKSHP
jgi:hypothetical protein